MWKCWICGNSIFTFKKINLFILVGRLLPYNIVVVFAIHLHESAMGVHVTLILNLFPPASPYHPSRLSQCTGFECPVLCMKFVLVIYFTYGNIHISVLFSQIIPPSSSPTESKSLLFISASILLSYIYGHHDHLFKYICISILYWCFSF